ncbi:glyoxalase superfamily protein [Acinetobacter sp. CIP 102637]|uniref:glyoxalase superfamily protein n=1 Tax=Acinetobacter sp. CIP 102637 TaxID=1144669 RepID=UPI001D170F90|nr:glyoxalase superfamily protein [Acinetobacter sp. CIP 102637]
MAFTRIAPLIRIFDENKAKEFYVEFLGFNIDFEHRDSDDARLYMQVSNYFHECHQYLTFDPKKAPFPLHQYAT